MDSLHIKENKMEFQILEEIKMNLLVKKENQIKMIQLIKIKNLRFKNIRIITKENQTKMIQLIKRYSKNNIFIKIIDKMIII